MNIFRSDSSSNEFKRRPDRDENPASRKLHENGILSGGEAQVGLQNSISNLITALTDCLNIERVDITDDCNFRLHDMTEVILFSLTIHGMRR
jgi:hypothetical protein